MKTFFQRFAIAALALFMVPQGGTAQNIPGMPPGFDPFNPSGGMTLAAQLPPECQDLEHALQSVYVGGIGGKLGSMLGGIMGGGVDFGDIMGGMFGMGLDLLTGGLGGLAGGLLGGIFGGDKTASAIEELTDVQLAALITTECYTRINDQQLEVIEEHYEAILHQIEEGDREVIEQYNETDVREHIEEARQLRQQMGYLSQYAQDEYTLLYDTYNRLLEYESDPAYQQEIVRQFRDHNIEEADELIIAAHENWRLRGETHDFINTLTWMGQHPGLTPMQAQQIQIELDGIRTRETAELSRIMATNNSFMAQRHKEEIEREKDAEFFNDRYTEEMDMQMEHWLQTLENTPRRGLVPGWARHRN